MIEWIGRVKRKPRWIWVWEVCGNKVLKICQTVCLSGLIINYSIPPPLLQRVPHNWGINSSIVFTVDNTGYLPLINFVSTLRDKVPNATGSSSIKCHELYKRGKTEITNFLSSIVMSSNLAISIGDACYGPL